MASLFFSTWIWLSVRYETCIDDRITVSMMWNRPESMVSFSLKISELFILSYLITLGKILLYNPFQSSRVLFFFNSAIDENKNESDCRKFLFPANILPMLPFPWRVCIIIREPYIVLWEESNFLKDFKWSRKDRRN